MKSSVESWVRFEANIARMVAGNEYFYGRKHHRNPYDGPAVLIRDVDTGLILEEQYLRHGQFHRDPRAGPAWRAIDFATGHETQVEYRVSGVLHRNPFEGPALISRLTDGTWRAEFRWNGDLLRATYKDGDTIFPLRSGRDGVPRNRIDEFTRVGCTPAQPLSVFHTARGHIANPPLQP